MISDFETFYLLLDKYRNTRAAVHIAEELIINAEYLDSIKKDFELAVEKLFIYIHNIAPMGVKHDGTKEEQIKYFCELVDTIY